MCRGAALVKPNHHEARRLASCQPSDEMDFLDLGRRIAELIPGTAILITRGALGMSLFRADHAPMHVPTVARNVYDVTGAGDTAIGSLAAALAAGVLLEHAVVFANQCAAIAVGKLGTTAITFDEITLPRGRAS
jgi:D-beta-D-heptose 7-phosphate kinase/D-beta-D-heptose 1-phosphate adenosyltransferase